MQSQTYTDRSNCARAARRHLGPDAKQGVDFVLVPEGGKFRFVASNGKPEASIPAAEGGNRLATMPADQIPANVPGNSLIAAYVDANPLPQGAVVEANGHARAPDTHPLAHLADQLGLKSTYRTAETAAIAALGKGARVGTDFFIKKTARGDYVWKSAAYVEAEKELEMGKRKESTRAGASKARGKVAGKTEAAGQPRVRKDYADALASAEKGVLPKAPDFNAATHERFRPKLAELVKLAKAGDLKALKAYPINPVSSSPKAMDRYRNLAVVALEARAKGGAAGTKH